MVTAIACPELRENSEQKNMQYDGNIYGQGNGQKQEKQIERVKKGRLESAEKRRPGKEMWIPKGKIAILKLPEAEITPVNELIGNVRLRGRKDLAS